MRYVSTRGASPPIAFEDLLLSGPAPDGGLYVPDAWPQFSSGDLDALRGKPYADVVAAVFAKYADPAWAALAANAAREVYARFDHRDVAPLVELSHGRYLLELFHGPTLAFKDFALQLLAPLMSEALKRGNDRALVVVATSGDTGAAAIAALAGRPNVEVVVLHPKGRISDVQRRQMTTAKEKNVRNIALEGTFDDAQALVKALFADAAFAKEHRLTAVNSINWVRIAAQIAYYVATCLKLRGAPVTFSVPTGNFGDVFAGYAAMRMGLPVAKLVIATNANDILVRALTTGVYARGKVHATMSPAMDIQVASNFERLIYEANDRNARAASDLLAAFARSGTLTLDPKALAAMRDAFDAVSIGEEETIATIRRVHTERNILIDPHTAVGIAAAAKRAPQGPVVTLATAHPSKFPDAVARATGQRPPLPERLQWILETPERYDVLANDLVALKRYLASG